MQDRKGSWRVACAALVVGMGLGGAASAQEFRLVAGGAVGDGGPALQANLASAADAVYDAAGNLYISQTHANRIRKIAPNGTITTVVGGSTGFFGDGGLASAAKIDRPGGLALDAAGNLYFSDTGNRRVRRVSPSGVITTVAGNGSRVHSGDNGGAALAGFASVEGLAIDASGNLFVADSLSHRIRKITPGGMISTIAGNGTAGYSGDNGTATNAQLNAPLGIDIDAAGTLYIADNLNNAIRRVTTAGTITTLGVLPDDYPSTVAVGPTGAIYAPGVNSCRLYRWPSGTATTYGSVAGNGECGETIEGAFATTSRIGAIEGIAFDPQGRVVYVEWETDKVRRLSDNTTSATLQTIAGVGGSFADGRAAIGAPLDFIHGIAFDAAGNLLLNDTGHRRVRRISTAGTIESLTDNAWWNMCANVAPPCAAKGFGFVMPWGIAPGNAAGEVLVGDRSRDRIYTISPTGTLSEYAGASTGTIGADGPANGVRLDPHGIVRTPGGDLYIADYRANKVRRLNAGTVTTIAGSGSAGSGGDGGPATSATLNQPMALALDAAGNVYVSEDGGRRVRKFAVNGAITTIAGNGQDGVSGDGGPAISAAIGRVLGIAVNGSDVYLASEGALRRIDATGTISSVPGWTHYASALAIRGGELYVGTWDGAVYATSLGTTPIAAVDHDYDGDGRSDTLWRNAQTGANTIWKAANNAQQQAVIGVTNQAWKIVGQGDFDGDGRDDIVWRNVQTGMNSIWRSGNGATTIAVTGVTNGAWAIVGVGDIDGDGKSDLVWRNNATGANVAWRSGNSATQTVVTGVSNLQWKIVGVGDFDGDGRDDLLWRNGVTGANAIWRSANNATQIAIASVPNLAWKVQGVGDFDGDGRDDILWRHTGAGTNQVWNGGNATSGRALTTVGPQTWKVVAVGDYDGDGKDDLLWRNAASGANQVWKSANSATVQPMVGVTNFAWSIVPYEFQP